MRLTTEAYYKNMTDVVPYDIDNVRIRYFGEKVQRHMLPELKCDYLASW